MVHPIVVSRNFHTIFVSLCKANHPGLIISSDKYLYFYGSYIEAINLPDLPDNIFFIDKEWLRAGKGFVPLSIVSSLLAPTIGCLLPSVFVFKYIFHQSILYLYLNTFQKYFTQVWSLLIIGCNFYY